MLFKETTNILKNKRRESFVNKNLNKKVDYNKPYVYFPLHVEPERSLLIAAPYFTNQIEVVKNIAKSLPIDYLLYVKEHPAMKFFWRDSSYYKEIISIPNVKLIHPSVPSNKIISNCSLVITIGGTAALEATFYKKPALAFSDFWGNELFTSIYRVKNFEELPKAIRTYLNKKVELKELSIYLDVFEENAFDFDNMEMLFDIWERFYYGGKSFNVNISEIKFKSFLDEYSSIFEMLANEHVKKINQYKKALVEK